MTTVPGPTRLNISAVQRPERVESVSANMLLAHAGALHAVIDALPDGVVVAGRSGSPLLCNPAAHRLVGFALTVTDGDWLEGAGCYLPDCVTPYPSDQLPTARALRDEACENVEIFLRSAERPHGAWINLSANPFHDSAGVLIGTIAIFRDITEAKRSTAILGRLSAAVETTSDSVVMTDLDGTIVYVNPAFERTTGYSSEEAVGATPRILKSGSHDKPYYDEMWAALRSGEVFRDVLLNRRKDGGTFHSEQTITPVRDPNGTISNYVSLMRDISEQRRAVQKETEMSLARDVQQRLYPRTSAHIRGYDVAGVMHPAERQMVSGDYFDVFPMAGEAIGIAVGDVCGHGISAALIMAQMRAYVRSFSLMHEDVNTVLARVNDALVGDLAAENFVTLVLARFDPGGRTFTYANGGHLSGYVLDARGEVRESVPSNGIALGFFPGRNYEPRPPVSLGRGETLLLFTDGIVESASPADEEFGTARAVATVAAHIELPAAAIAETLYAAARNFAGQAPQVDDMTVFVCKATGECGS